MLKNIAVQGATSMKLTTNLLQRIDKLMISLINRLKIKLFLMKIKIKSHFI